MNIAKRMAFITCSLMMSVMMHGMELEKSNEPFISQDRIFVWTGYNPQYHVVTVLGNYSEHDILQKNDQPHKIYRAQLVIQKNKEGEEGKKYFVKTTQEYICNGTEAKFKNLTKLERIEVPTFWSQEQCDGIRYKLNSCLDRKKAVLAIDNDGNEYFITHVWDENRDNSKKVRVYNTEKHRAELIPVLNKKKMLLEIQNLKQDVAEFKKIAVQIQIAKDRFNAEKLPERLNRSRNNDYFGLVMSCATYGGLIVLGILLAALIPQYQG